MRFHSQAYHQENAIDMFDCYLLLAAENLLDITIDTLWYL